MAALALIAVLIIGVFLLFRLLSGGESASTDVEIPNLTGVPAEEAFEVGDSHGELPFTPPRLPAGSTPASDPGADTIETWQIDWGDGSPGRWMHTGDIATMDADGYVRIVGRSKDMLIRGGENIYPREIEEFLYTYPKIDQVEVVGVPDEKFGEEIAACIRLFEGETATVDEIRDFCRGKLSHFKIPRYVKFVEEFPLTVTGKVQKFILREQLTEELEQSSSASQTMGAVR